MVMMKTYKWQKLNHIEILELEVKLKMDLLIQMYTIIVLFHIKYKKILNIYNCFGFETSPIKLDK